MNGQYWVFDWFGSLGIENSDDINRTLRDGDAVENLRSAARACEWQSREPIEGDGARVLAGRAIDLSGELDCWGWECRMRQLDQLLSRVWLYFDKVVVSDWLTSELTSETFALTDSRRERLISDLSLLLRIWKVGAAPFLAFRAKPPICQHHWPAKIQELGLQPMQERALSRAQAVAETAEIQITPCDRGAADCIHYSLVHKLFEHTVWGNFVRDSAGDSDLRVASARDALHRYFDYLVSDIWASRYYRSSLGCTLASHQNFLAGQSDDPEAVVFQLNLPFLGGADFASLFKLRQDEAEHFERFRSCLRRAFDGRLRGPKRQSEPDVTKAIVSDLIEPALASIRDRLRASERLLKQKTAVGLFFGSIATTCGLLAGANPTLSVGAGVSTAVALTSGAINKHLEEKRDVQLDDMYFLWKALSHLPHPPPRG